MTSLQRLSRDEFFGTDESADLGYFRYEDGEHAAYIYPTQKGKTHLAWQTLAAAKRQRPHLNIVTLMPKALSPSTARWAKAMNFRETPEWPPRKKFLEAKPNGYVVWPKHYKELSAEADRAQVAQVLGKAMHQQFWRGNTITFADDLHLLAVLMGLNATCEEFWTAGGEGGSALWGANQKPSGTANSGAVSTYFYNSSTHFFLGRDTDERNQKRFSEIGGGVDPREIAEIVKNLRLYQIGPKTISEVLYIDARGPYKCLIGP
jgi:hypothetical protein